MSIAEQNRQVIEQMYAAGMAGDIAGLLRHLAEDVVIDEPSFLPYAGLYRGRDGMAGLFGVISQYLDVAKMQVNYLLADGDRVAACLGIPDTTTGKLTHFIEQSTLRDGKVVELKLFYYDAGTMIDRARAAGSESN